MKIKNDAAVYCNILVTKKQTNQTNSIIQARKIFEKKIDTSKDYIRQHKESLNQLQMMLTCPTSKSGSNVQWPRENNA